uniref:FGFR1 oncogene partner (FOP) N-terminal dimerisation domain-containing protein n=1 Tax=Oryzias latipes TaxID=8090 RepID=A0A3P9KUL6_ORYLA
MSAAEDDTELRDLVIQNLENSGVLNKMKAEMRAAVFLAMEDQDRLENKVPLVNESLKKCLNSRDGRLAVAFIVDFLQVFSLDFSLAVFLPEINSPNGVDSREVVCRELGLRDSEVDKSSPLLLELLRTAPRPPQQQELSQKQLQNVQKTFDLYKNPSGLLQRRDLKSIFTDLLPSLNEHDLEEFFANELQAADQEMDFQFFLLLFKRLLPRCSHADGVPVFPADNEDLQQLTTSPNQKQEHLDLDLNAVVNLEEEDSFFDDPLPKPQKTYGCPTSSDGEKDFPEKTQSQQWTGPAETRGSHAESLSGALRPGGRGGAGSRKGASDSRDGSFRAPSDRTDEDFEYDDDFHSHRSELSKSEQSIDEEIQEVSIEGPDSSDKLEETTLDVSVSQLSQADAADFMEDVS